MSKHDSSLIMCRKQPGISIGRLCERCDGRCPICDGGVSESRQGVVVRTCDDCNYGNSQGKCLICGANGFADAYYCRECCLQEKDRDGCPKLINMGSARMDLFYERKKYGYQSGLNK